MYGQENSNGSSSTSPVLPAPSRSTSSGPIAISAFSRALSVRLPNVVLPRKNSEKSSSLGDESYSKTNSSLSSLTSLSSPVTSSTSPSVAATLLDEEGQSPPEKEGIPYYISFILLLSMSRLGWLKKQGNNVQKDWKRRYIVIRSNRLYYYRSYDVRPPFFSGFLLTFVKFEQQDFLASSPINFVELMTSAVKPAIAVNKFRFELVTVNRSFWFQAENAHELNDWLNSLRTAIGQALSSGTSAAESTQAPASPEHAIASAANKSAMEHLRQNPGNRVCADCGAAGKKTKKNMFLLFCCAHKVAPCKTPNGRPATSASSCASSALGCTAPWACRSPRSNRSRWTIGPSPRSSLWKPSATTSPIASGRRPPSLLSPSPPQTPRGNRNATTSLPSTSTASLSSTVMSMPR